MSAELHVVIASPGGVAGGGGVGSVSREISDWLRQRRPDVPVTVIDTRGEGPAALSIVFLLSSLIRLVICRLSGATLVHLQVTERGSFIRKGMIQRAARVLGMRTIAHHHGAEFIKHYPTASGDQQRWIAETLRKADLNAVLSEQMRSFLTNELGVEQERVHVLRNAVADVGYGCRTASDDRTMHVLMVANLSPRKGVSTFLATVAEMSRQGREVRATLAGGGQVDRYVHEAAALGIADRCTFTGWIAHAGIETLLRSADALVLPSLDEGLPMAILEALSAGVPVVATPVGAIPEVLTSERDCLLVPPEDVPALTQAMLRLCDDDCLRQRLRQDGRALYERLFQIDAFMERLLSLYRIALQPENPAP